MASPVPRRDVQFVLESTHHLWEELRSRRIFITGGTGFFGCWLLETFCYVNRVMDLGAEAVVLTRDPQGFARKCPHLASDPALSLHFGDVRTFEFPSLDFDFAIHAATDASAKQATEQPLEMLSTIIAGTERTIQFSAEHGVRKFLFISSGAVYGEQPPWITHLPETYLGGPDTLAPMSVYGESKRVAELLCSIYSMTSGVEFKIARCWAFCGPHLPLNQHFAIGNFIADVLAGRPIRISGDGTARRSYLYAADLAIWLWTLLFRAPALVPFNVGSAQDLSILELAQTVAATLGATSEIRLGREPVAGAPISRYVPSVARAETELGLRETVSLAEAIRLTAQWSASS